MKRSTTSLCEIDAGAVIRSLILSIDNDNEVVLEVILTVRLLEIRITGNSSFL